VVVGTAQGPARWLLDEAEEPGAALLLGHGAGGGPLSADLAVLARRLPPLGITVARFEQPWRTAGRRVAVAPPKLDEAWLEALPVLRSVLPPDLPVASGGRSAGARVACRTASLTGAAAVVCLAFPLHPPGRPDRSRAAELLTPAVPRLVLQGTRDTFGGPEEVRTATAHDPGVVVVDLPGADHGYRLPAGAAFAPADLRDTLVAEVAALLGVAATPS
jgi:predicted alpha/beta-hydrolase family hydrolase